MLKIDSKNIIVIIFIFTTLFSCIEDNNHTIYPPKLTSSAQAAVDKIKNVEYTNIDLFRNQIHFLNKVNINNDALTNLYIKHYTLKADFLQKNSIHSLNAFNTIYDELKENNLLKLMTEIDLFSAFFYYESNKKNIESFYVKRMYEYSFEQEELFLENQVLLYGISTDGIKYRPKDKKSEIEKVLKELEHQKWSIYHSRIMYNLALAHYYLNDYQQAKSSLLLSIKNDEQIDNNYQIAISYNMLAFIESKIFDNNKKFVKYQEKAISYKKIFGAETTSTNYRSIGHSYFNNNQFLKAYDAYNDAIENNFLKDSASLSEDYAYVGWAYFNIDPEKHFSTAMQYYNKAISFSTKGEIGYMIALERKIWSLERFYRMDEVNALIAELLKAQNAAYLKGSKNEISDIMTNNMLEIKSKDQNLKILKHQNQQQKTKIEYQKIINRIYFILIIAFLVLLYLFFQNKKNLKKNKKLNLKLQKSITQINEKNQEISKLLQLNEKTLFAKVLKISTYRDAINNLISHVSDLSQMDEPISNNKLFSLNQTLKTLINEDESWEEFKTQFEKTRPNFFEKLKSINSDMSINELKHCTYIASELTTKDVANLINVSPRTVETARYRIKKKLGLTKNEKLANFLNDL